MGHHFWQYGAVLPETDFTFQKFITCLSLLAKQVSTKLSGIDFNQAKYHFKNVKSRFSTKQDWLYHNTTEMICEIDFTFVFGSI